MMEGILKRRLLLLALFATLALTTAPAQRLTWLGTLGGRNLSGAKGVSADGGVVARTLVLGQICGTPLLTEEILHEAVQNSLQKQLPPQRSLQKALGGDTIGVTREFYVLYNNQYWVRDFVLVRAGIGANLWVEIKDTARIPQRVLDTIIAHLVDYTPAQSRNPRRGIVPLIDSLFGIPPYKDSDRDQYGQTDFLITSPLDSMEAGFFNPWDQRDTIYSNRADVLYFSTDYIIRDTTFSFLSTFAHEYQHLVQYRYKGKTKTEFERVHRFMNEGLSQVAEDVCGYPLKAEDVRAYYNGVQQRSRASFIDWNEADYDDGVLDDYARAALFSIYFWEQLGDSVLKAIVQNPYQGFRAWDTAFKQVGNISFRQLFENFALALLIQDRSVDARYGFRNKAMAEGLPPSFFISEYEDRNYTPLIGEAGIHFFDVDLPYDRTALRRILLQRATSGLDWKVYLCLPYRNGGKKQWRIEASKYALRRLLQRQYSPDTLKNVWCIVVNADTADTLVDYRAEFEYLNTTKPKIRIGRGALSGRAGAPVLWEFDCPYGDLCGSLLEQYGGPIYQLIVDSNGVQPMLLAEECWHIDPFTYLGFETGKITECFLPIFSSADQQHVVMQVHYRESERRTGYVSDSNWYGIIHYTSGGAKKVLPIDLRNREISIGGIRSLSPDLIYVERRRGLMDTFNIVRMDLQTYTVNVMVRIVIPPALIQFLDFTIGKGNGRYIAWRESERLNGRDYESRIRAYDIVQGVDFLVDKAPGSEPFQILDVEDNILIYGDRDMKDLMVYDLEHRRPLSAADWQAPNGFTIWDAVLQNGRMFWITAGDLGPGEDVWELWTQTVANPQPTRLWAAFNYPYMGCHLWTDSTGIYWVCQGDSTVYDYHFFVDAFFIPRDSLSVHHTIRLDSFRVTLPLHVSFNRDFLPLFIYGGVIPLRDGKLLMELQYDTSSGATAPDIYLINIRSGNVVSAWSAEHYRERVPIEVLPNPVHDVGILRLPSSWIGKKMRIRLRDVLGRTLHMIFNGVLQSPTINLDLSKLPSSIYFIDLITAEGVQRMAVISVLR
ncbi:MAG: hypothetical protein KatS3mg039_1686 [Candidatus Kapaibacterium sp.]|nr:MAG: hypothetical protein KatS3mg039_1686 [Candidatus Kapabacteria bacterium]